MVVFDYILTAVLTANYDYTGYTSLLEVIDDFRDFIKREMWEESAMAYSINDERVYTVAKFSRLEFAINELDFLQECIDEFSNFSFADLFADVKISQVNVNTGESVDVLNVHIQAQK